MRRIITTALAKHPEIEIVGYGHNGLEAIAKVKELAPEVVTMDIEMPEMNGLAALREIRKTDRLTPIIMFSTLTQAGAQATVTALMDGATDYVGKPTSISGGAEAALKVLDAELVPKIIGLARRRRRPKPERPARPERPERTAVATPPLGSPLPSPAGYQLASPPPGGAAPVAALVIGVSTGGPVALQEIFTTFTAPLSVPVFIVQHMPPAFTSLLAARLTATTVMDFRVATNDEIPAPGTVYLAPG
ncbi:MAG: chemotaxis protein CheB, partial [Betaproteobacteria bacterium]